MNTKIIIASIALLVLLAGCTQVKYNDYSDGSFSAKYPSWSADSGTDDISVSNNGCQVRINNENPSFGNADLSNAVNNLIVPVLENLGLEVQSSVSGNEAVLQLSGSKVVGKQKYVVCDGKLYKVYAACTKDNAVIDEVIASASCTA